MVTDLKLQIEHVFEHNQFQIDIFYGLQGSGKRSCLNAAIDKCDYNMSIFFIEIDALFTKTEYHLLHDIFSCVKAEDILYIDDTEVDMKKRKILAKSWKKDCGFKNLREKESKKRSNKALNGLSKYDNNVDKEGRLIWEMDAQDALMEYSKLQNLLKSFDIIIYLKNADVFTKTKRQSFFYNLLEMSKKHSSRGIIVLETQDVNFIENLEKRNASRMNPRKFVFSDFSYDKEIIEIIKLGLPDSPKRSAIKNKLIKLFETDSVRTYINYLIYRDFTISQMLEFISAFLRQMEPSDLNKLDIKKIPRLQSTQENIFFENIKCKMEKANIELDQNFKMEIFYNNLNFTEQIILAILNKYETEKEPPSCSVLVKVKNIENNICNQIRGKKQSSYKTSRDLIHSSIENLERMGLLKLSKRNLNLETILYVDIDPDFSSCISEFAENNNVGKNVRLEVLDKK